MCHAINYYKHSLESIYITMDFYRTFDDNRERDIILSITHCFIEAKGWHPLYFFQKCITLLWISYKSLIFQRSYIPYKSKICIECKGHLSGICMGCFTFLYDKSSYITYGDVLSVRDLSVKIYIKIIIVHLIC